MKSGTSSLNPYATSYVPLVNRGPANVNKNLYSAQEGNSGNGGAVRFGHQPENTSPRLQHQNVSQSSFNRGGAGAIQTGEFSEVKDHHGGEFLASTSQYPNEALEKSNFDEDVEMDLAFLQMTFPGISEESLSHVYFASRCDLDAAVDMVQQLEIGPDDSSDKLPDTLDIGDVPESQSASHKVKNEAAFSKYGPPNLSATN